MDSDKAYAKAIASEYSAKTVPQVDELRKLDRKAKVPALVFAYAFGSIAMLVLGVGMCLSMDVIGSGVGYAFPLGIALGIVGIAGASANYFLYKGILQNGKDKYASAIMRLAREIEAN